jgi:Putative glucoamylase
VTARHNSTAAVTCALAGWPVSAARTPTRPISVIPRPQPGPVAVPRLLDRERGHPVRVVHRPGRHPAAGLCQHIQALRTFYPGIYGVGGFFDAVNPTTGAVGHHYLVLDQSMIMAWLDNALNNRAIQRYFAADPVSWAAHTCLELERMSI